MASAPPSKSRPPTGTPSPYPKVSSLAREARDPAVPREPLVPRDPAALLGRDPLDELTDARVNEAALLPSDDMDGLYDADDGAQGAGDVAMPPSHRRASVAPTPGHLISQAAEPAFAEIRTLLSSIVANAAFGRMVVAELEPYMDRLSDAARGLLPPEELEGVIAVLPKAIDAHRELTIAFAELDGVSKKLIDTVSGLEKTVAARSANAQTIGETVEAATLTAHHFTKLIGGVRWRELSQAAAQSRAPAWMGLVVSIALQELASRMTPANQDGIEGRIEVSGESVSIELGTPRLSEASSRDIVGDLSFLLNGVSLLDVASDGPTIRLRL